MEQGKSCLFFSYYNLCFCVPVPPSLWQEYCSSMVTFHQGIVNTKQGNKGPNFIKENISKLLMINYKRKGYGNKVLFKVDQIKM